MTAFPSTDTCGGIADRLDWRQAIEDRLPSLRAFAWSLCRNRSDADDLVQETLVKAWTYRRRFQPGTNLKAWLFTILRNTWYSMAAKHRREVADEDGLYAGRLSCEGNQESSCDLTDLRAALETLSPEYREAVVLVGAAGMSYEDAAEVIGCALGTLKSRVNRGRTRLAEAMAIPLPN